jgi:hypothetical protein
VVSHVLFSILVYTVLRVLTVNHAKILIVIWETIGMLPPVANNSLNPLRNGFNRRGQRESGFMRLGKWGKRGWANSSKSEKFK